MDVTDPQLGFSKETKLYKLKWCTSQRQCGFGAAVQWKLIEWSALSTLCMSVQRGRTSTSEIVFARTSARTVSSRSSANLFKSSGDHRSSLYRFVIRTWTRSGAVQATEIGFGFTNLVSKQSQSTSSRVWSIPTQPDPHRDIKTAKDCVVHSSPGNSLALSRVTRFPFIVLLLGKRQKRFHQPFFTYRAEGWSQEVHILLRATEDTIINSQQPGFLRWLSSGTRVPTWESCGRCVYRSIVAKPKHCKIQCWPL